MGQKLYQSPMMKYYLVCPNLKGKCEMPKWYNDKPAKIFQKVLSPFYKLFAYIFNKDIIVVSTPLIDRSSKNLFHYRNTYDYVRVRAMGFVANVINEENIQGDIAEFGVYRGDFAERINREFPDRTFLLYDTFEGFDSKQLKLDTNKKLVTDSDNNICDFSNTSAELVLKRMPFKNKCILRKGFFPNTTDKDLDRKFAFVSLDVDLETPTYDGIKFFYPRLSEGGYIFIHDYNNPLYLGVKNAVSRYEKSYGNLCKIQLPDSSGSIIIIKPYS